MVFIFELGNVIFFSFFIDNGILCKILIMNFFVYVFINIFKDFLGVIIGFFFVLYWY